MNINLAPVDENYLKHKVEAGYYSNMTEAVRDAVRRLREDDEKKARFLAAVRLGDEQIMRGETVEYTPALMDSLTQQALDNARKGKPVKADIKP